MACWTIRAQTGEYRPGRNLAGRTLPYPQTRARSTHSSKVFGLWLFRRSVEYACTWRLGGFGRQPRVLFYFPDDAAALYSPDSSLKKWQLRIIGHIPMLAERSSFWGKVELLRRGIEDIGMPKQQTTRYGRVQDFAALEAADLPSFNQRCHAILSQRTGFSPAIRQIIELAQQHGITIIFLEMPCLPDIAYLLLLAGLE